MPEPTRPRLATMPREDWADVPDAGRAIRQPARSYDEDHPTRSYDSGPSGGHSPGRLRRFVREYGWRAYALPLLIAITIFALMRMNEPGGPPRPASAAGASSASLRGAGPTAAAPRTVPTDTSMIPDKGGSSAQREVLASDALPPGGSYTQRGKGTFHVIPGTGPIVGSGTLHRYTIDIEDGVTGVNPATFAATVQAALNNPQSWTGHGSGVALQRVDSGPADFHITLTSAMTVRALCGYELKIETSCYAEAHDQRVTLNVARWLRGDMAYVGDLATYQVYMVNHESGHALGHSHAHACLKNGFAPVMMQQTISLKAANGKTCQANPWPYPPGASDAPGVEQPGT